MIEIRDGKAVNLNPRDLLEKSDLDELIQKSQIGIDDHFEREKYILQIVGENKHYTDVCSLGNISTTVGAAKSRKTFFSTMMLSAMVSDREEYGMRGCLYGKKVLFIDTEQAPFHVQKIGKRVQHITNKISNFDMLYLRHCPDMDTRLAVIDEVLYKMGKYYIFVVIDGVVDLVNDYNNQAECRKAISQIMSWSDIYNNHINCVIHTNKDKGYARGHLGAELVNKSEVVFRITKDDFNATEVTCDVSRNKEFHPFEFSIDKYGIPVREKFPTGYFNKI